MSSFYASLAHLAEPIEGKLPDDILLQILEDTSVNTLAAMRLVSRRKKMLIDHAIDKYDVFCHKVIRSSIANINRGYERPYGLLPQLTGFSDLAWLQCSACYGFVNDFHAQWQINIETIEEYCNMIAPEIRTDPGPELYFAAGYFILTRLWGISEEVMALPVQELPPLQDTWFLKTAEKYKLTTFDFVPAALREIELSCRQKAYLQQLKPRFLSAFTYFLEALGYVDSITFDARYFNSEGGGDCDMDDATGDKDDAGDDMDDGDEGHDEEEDNRVGRVPDIFDSTPFNHYIRLFSPKGLLSLSRTAFWNRLGLAYCAECPSSPISREPHAMSDWMLLHFGPDLLKVAFQRDDEDYDWEDAWTEDKAELVAFDMGLHWGMEGSEMNDYGLLWAVREFCAREVTECCLRGAPAGSRRREE